VGFSYNENTILMDSFGVWWWCFWWWQDSIYKRYGGQIFGYTVEGYF